MKLKLELNKLKALVYKEFVGDAFILVNGVNFMLGG